ncbi:phthiocerol/phthiodiolone dimycocerosyl transferase family protein [Pyxidicoccus sp. 3LG]
MRRPLSNTERAIWEFNRDHPMGASVALRITGPLDARVLEQALALVQERHPMLRVRVGDAGPPAYTGAGVGPIPLRVEPRRDASQWLEALEAEVNQRWLMHEGPLARVRLLSGGDTHDLIIGFQHMIADGMSAFVFGKHLLEFAAALVAGSPVKREQAPERPAIEELLPPRTRGAAGWMRAAGLAGEWGVHSLRGLFDMPMEVVAPPGQRRTRVLRHVLAPEETALLVQRSRERGTSVHGALCAAMLQTLVAAFRDAPETREARTIACISPVNLRRMLHPAIGDEIGLYMTPFGTAHRLSEVGDFWAVARAVRRGLREAMESGAVLGPLLVERRLPPVPFLQKRMLQLTEQLVPRPLTVTNVGVLEPVEAGPFRIEDIATVAPMGSVVGCGVALAAFTYAGAARLHFTYSEPLVSRVRAESLLHDALRRLRAAL